MHASHIILFALETAFSIAEQTKTYSFDCSRPELIDICKNDCWAKHCVRGTASGLLTYAPDRNDQNRQLSDDNHSGLPHPCRAQCGWNGGDQNRNTIEEYPFAITNEGGTYAALRCASSYGQSVQGGTIDTRSLKANDKMNIVLYNYENLGVDWCNGERYTQNHHSDCTNDNMQFVFSGGQYVLDDRGRAY